MPLADELCQYHMKAFVASPGPGQVPKTHFWDSRKHQNLHPYQLALPSFQLCGRVLYGQQSSGFPFFVAMPGGGFSSVKSFCQMSHQGHFSFDHSVGGEVVHRRGQYGIEYRRTGGLRRCWSRFYLWNWGCLSFMLFEMGLAHTIKVSLCLLGTALYLAKPRLGTVSLAQAL